VEHLKTLLMDIVKVVADEKPLHVLAVWFYKFTGITTTACGQIHINSPIKKKKVLRPNKGFM